MTANELLPYIAYGPTWTVPLVIPAVAFFLMVGLATIWMAIGSDRRVACRNMLSMPVIMVLFAVCMVGVVGGSYLVHASHWARAITATALADVCAHAGQPGVTMGVAGDTWWRSEANIQARRGTEVLASVTLLKSDVLSISDALKTGRLTSWDQARTAAIRTAWGLDGEQPTPKTTPSQP